jgi:hypothetical protein
MNFLIKKCKRTDSPKIITCTDIYAKNLQIFRQLSETGCRWEECKEPYGKVIEHRKLVELLNSGQRIFVPAQATMWNHLFNGQQSCVKLKDGLWARPMEAWKKIRCYSPKDEQIIAWFEKKGYKKKAINHAIINANGDIRKFKTSIKMFFMFENDKIKPMVWDNSQTSLKAIGSLVTKQSTPSDWADDSTLFDSNRRVLHQNLDRLSEKQDEIQSLDSVSKVCDSLTYTDNSIRENQTFMVPPHFRTHLALQTQLALPCRRGDVPLLHLGQDRSSCTLRKPSDTHSSWDIRMSDSYDIPAILGGKKFQL